MLETSLLDPPQQAQGFGGGAAGDASGLTQRRAALAPTLDQHPLPPQVLADIDLVVVRPFFPTSLERGHGK
jgi:hypothetical protein